MVVALQLRKLKVRITKFFGYEDSRKRKQQAMASRQLLF